MRIERTKTSRGRLVAIGLAVSVAGACGNQSGGALDAPATTTAETSMPTSEAPTVTAATVPAADAPRAVTDDVASASWTVVDVVDGDTLDVAGPEGTIATVRLIGIDSPERGACFSAEASDGLRFFAAVGSSVQLAVDTSEVDRYGRLLRYVEVVAPDGTVLDVGAELVGLGFAVAKQYPPDTARAHIYDLRQIDAERSARGQWAPGTCAAPVPVTPAPTVPATTPAPPPPVVTAAPAPATAAPPAIVPFATIPAAANCHPSYPTVCIPGGPDLDCGDISARRFEVLPPDPHGFDGTDNDGIGCESG
jgi:micrococcal nuclease